MTTDRSARIQPRGRRSAIDPPVDFARQENRQAMQRRAGGSEGRGWALTIRWSLAASGSIRQERLVSPRTIPRDTRRKLSALLPVPRAESRPAGRGGRRRGPACLAEAGRRAPAGRVAAQSRCRALAQAASFELAAWEVSRMRQELAGSNRRCLTRRSISANTTPLALLDLFAAEVGRDVPGEENRFVSPGAAVWLP